MNRTHNVLVLKKSTPQLPLKNKLSKKKIFHVNTVKKAPYKDRSIWWTYYDDPFKNINIHERRVLKMEDNEINKSQIEFYNSYDKIIKEKSRTIKEGMGLSSISSIEMETSQTAKEF